MFQRTHLWIVAAALAAALAGFFASRQLQPPAGQTSEKVGMPAPALNLPDPDGRPRRLDEWRGQLVLVNVWASWCAPCVEEMPVLDAAAKRYGERGLVVVGVASDTAAAARDFLGRHPVGYPILIDDPDAAARSGDAAVTLGDTRGVLPYSVLVGRDGRILAQRFGNFTENSLDGWLAPHL